MSLLGKWFGRMLVVGGLFVGSPVMAADPASDSRFRDIPPRKWLDTFLQAECQPAFQARLADVAAAQTPEQIAARQNRLRKQFITAIGGFPERTPLRPERTGTLVRKGYRIEKIIFESRPNHHVTANVYLPDGPGPFPAVLIPVGHSQTGKAADYQQRAAQLLVQNGFVAMTYDPIGQGERVQVLDALGKPALPGSTSEHTMTGVGALLGGRCTASYRIWDGIRALDYLTSRPEVDAKRIGCTGCSGGGTLTSYLMALDDRIQAAAPSCYLTTFERLFATIGPQDGEQNLPGQVAFGFDHADFLTLRAPKPTLICAATRDFFDIQGTWTTFREAKRLYSRLGFPERVELLESDTPHGYPKAHREGMVRWMSRWLKQIDSPITETELPLESIADLNCTRSGHVLEDRHGVSVFTLNAQWAAELAAKRQQSPQTIPQQQDTIRRLIGISPNRLEFTASPWSEPRTIGNRIIRTQTITPKFGIPLTIAEVRSKTMTGTAANLPPILLLHEAGHGVALNPNPSDDPIEPWIKGDRTVIVADLRGMGTTAPGIPANGKPNYLGVDSREAFLAMHLNRPLLGQRVEDGQMLLKHLNAQTHGVELVAVGACGPIGLHLAALEPSVKMLTLERSILSWQWVTQTPLSQNQFTNVVPNALAHYDLGDLLAMIAPRPLVIFHAQDATGRPASADAITSAVSAAHKRYADSNRLAKLRILP